MPRHNQRNIEYLQRQTMDIATSTPQVITQRVTQMMTPGYNPNGKDQAEFNRMFKEKNAAFYESWMAMGWATVQAQQKMMLDITRMMTTLFSPMKNTPAKQLNSLGQIALSAQLSVLNKGLKPVSSRVKANAKRLKK